MEKLLLSPGEAAAHLSIGRSKVYELMRLGQLRSVKIGASRRIPQAALADSSRLSPRNGVDESPGPRRGFGVPRWRPMARCSLTWLRPDGRRIRKKVSGATKGEVLRKLRDLRAELNAGVPMPDDRLTVAAFLDRWLTASLPGQVSEKAFDSYADTVRLHIKPSLGRKVLRKLTVSDVDQLLAWKRNAGYSANTVRIIRAVLRRALKQAEREGLVSRNVAALSAPPRVRSNEGRALSVDQARTLLDQVRGTRDEALMTVMLALGLRRGEALGLHWSALDWDAATLKVTHAVKRVRDRTETPELRTRLMIGEPKTARSRRTLFLTPELVELLRRHRARLAKSGWQSGRPGENTT